MTKELLEEYMEAVADTISNQQPATSNQERAEFSPAIGRPARCIWGTTSARWRIA